MHGVADLNAQCETSQGVVHGRVQLLVVHAASTADCFGEGDDAVGVLRGICSAYTYQLTCSEMTRTPKYADSKSLVVLLVALEGDVSCTVSSVPSHTRWTVVADLR